MKLSIFATGSVFAFLAPIVAQAAIAIQVTPSLAPNAFGSPSYGGYVTNAVSALYTGATSAGTPGTPTYYEADANVQAHETVVTGFKSWKGKADPGTVFGPAHANELGNRMLFGLSIVGTGGDMFALSELGFSATSNDAGNTLGFGFGAGSYNYSNDYQGVLYGGDGVLGGGDDTFVIGGLNTQLVNALFGRGSGSSFAAYCAVCTTAQQQAQIDGVVDFMKDENLTQFTGTYTLAGRGASGSGTFNISAVPEPATWAMMIIGFGGVGSMVRANRRRQALVLA